MSAKIIGHVLDNNKRPLDKVKISSKGKLVATSGEDGFFSIVIGKPELSIALTFEKEGYVSNTKIFNTKAQCKYLIIIWPCIYQCWFDPFRDLDIILGGSRIRIPADALIVKDKSVLLKFTLFDVTNQFERQAAPGNYIGKSFNGNITRLNSYGIFDLGLFDQKGRPLSLRKGAEIDLSLEITPKLIKQAPKIIGLYSMNMDSGLWIQSGNFNLDTVNRSYQGKITRFGGAHNLDDPQDTTCVKLRVVRIYTLEPMPAGFCVRAEGAQYYFDNVTDSNGYVCLLVQRNASFVATAWGNLGSDSNWGTPYPTTFISPDFSSGINDCGNPTLCPFLGNVEVDLIV
jgi:hypothetical protein